jgi:hypothetical protein
MFDVVSAKLDKKDGSALSLKEFIRSLLDETSCQRETVILSLPSATHAQDVGSVHHLREAFT